MAKILSKYEERRIGEMAAESTWGTTYVLPLVYSHQALRDGYKRRGELLQIALAFVLPKGLAQRIRAELEEA